jgi:hypothetical protein
LVIFWLILAEVIKFCSHKYTYYGLYCSIEFSFLKNYHNELIRKKQFNEVDFLSFVGGLLGLFAGFSALSFIEAIYWTFGCVVSWIVRFKKNSVRPSVTEQDQTDENRQKNLIKEFFSESSIHGFAYIFTTNKLQM